jgi:hypothetical protein
MATPTTQDNVRTVLTDIITNLPFSPEERANELSVVDAVVAKIGLDDTDAICLSRIKATIQQAVHKAQRTAEPMNKFADVKVKADELKTLAATNFTNLQAPV